MRVVNARNSSLFICGMSIRKAEAIHRVLRRNNILASSVFLMLTLAVPFAHSEAPEVLPPLKKAISPLEPAESRKTCDTCAPQNLNSIDDLKRVACEDLVKNFCERLSHSEQKIDGQEHSVQLGQMEEFGIPRTRYAYLQTLTESAPNLPADLQTRWDPLLATLREHLKNPLRPIDWRRKLADIEVDLERSITDVAWNRFKRKYPEIASEHSDWTNLLPRGEALFQNIKAELKSEAARAQWKNHPNWQRVERTFVTTQALLREEIAQMNVTATEKKFLQERVDSVRLVIPSFDPADGMSPPTSDDTGACATTQENAFYNTATNTYTVCAGWVMGITSDSHLISSMAHELAHSIDPDTTCRAAWRNSEPMKYLQKLTRIDAGLLCIDWSKFWAGFNPAVPKTEPIDKKGTTNLYRCLGLKSESSGLKKWNAARIAELAEETAEEYMGTYAEVEDFTDMIVEPPPKISAATKKLNDPLEDEGSDSKDFPRVRPSENQTRQRQRELYLKPELIAAANHGASLKDPSLGERYIELFMFKQNFLCNKQDKDKAMEEALEQTLEQAKRILIYETTFCGRDSLFLKGKPGYSRQVGEEYPDWVADRVFARYLAKEPNLKARRQAFEFAIARRCNSKLRSAEETKLAEIEKQYSTEEHGVNETRINKLLSTEGIPELLNCQMKNVEKKCKLELVK